MASFDKEALEKFCLSGKILRETREEMKSCVFEGMRIIEVCEKAESLIIEKGGKPAFPCNVSINEVAAHYTSPPGDASVIPKGSLVKVDLGVHIDGYVTDTAFTVCFNSELRGMVEAAQEALRAAIDFVSSDVSVGKIGGVIENVIKNRGFKPISNLTGHSLGRYLVHAGTSIPNVSQVSFKKLKLGGIYALEPFVTFHDAEAVVEDMPKVTIFRLVKPKAAKSSVAKKLLKFIERNFRTLPFAERWLDGVVSKDMYEVSFKELLDKKAIMGYPVFVEKTKKPVAQAEHTVLVEENGCVVLT